ncbi:hypothetical protein CPT_Minot_053 [Acinetobacter phage Minot]|nr:hypothetical protein CPT_Maestro_059 [Acinetobacter phage Maestro]QQM18549.1 hypothetical protein CPT_Morttis_056 [Acinetobacter phage Morttis]QQO96256.1 hypothetical protein CPT_Minot_053 [Acinetobacter phage Minot]QQO96505.1 hypothetical protein CPT_Mokit_054 [Acinetobacter phage Mokit]QQO96759.1 hypothetical protein CPT_Melin_058 [Acinetobacter phage Melin]
MSIYLVTEKEERHIEFNGRDGWDCTTVVNDVKLFMMDIAQISELLAFHTHTTAERDKLIETLEANGDVSHSYKQYEDSEYYTSYNIQLINSDIRRLL